MMTQENEGLEVIYIEDETMTANRTKRELLALGYKTVDVCKDWPEAEIKLAEKGSTYDAAILDIQLEGSDLDGVDAACILNARYSLPILMVTSFSEPRTMARLEALPAAGYILKPATGVQIDAGLRRLIRIKPILSTAGATTEKPTGARLADKKLDAPLLNFRASHAEKFSFDQMLYLKADGGQVMLYRIGGKAKPLSMGMDKAINFFDRDDLIRVHKSYAVPYHAIKKVAHKEIELVNGEKVPVGDRYRDGLR